MSTVPDTPSDEPRVESHAHTDQPDGATPLATRIKEIDTDRDTRDCPHECHGELSVDDDDRVLCQSCRCTPSGVYIPPDERSVSGQPRGLAVHFFYPKGLPVQKQDERERYSYSKNVILPGGHEAVYDENNPRGGTDEYVFNITTF